MSSAKAMPELDVMMASSVTLGFVFRRNLIRMIKEMLTLARPSMNHESLHAQGSRDGVRICLQQQQGSEADVTSLFPSCPLHHHFPWQPPSSSSLSRPSPSAAPSQPLLSLPSLPSFLRPPALASPLSG